MNESKKKQMDINANQKLRQNETNGDQCGSKIEAKTIETGIMCIVYCVMPLPESFTIILGRGRSDSENRS